MDFAALGSVGFGRSLAVLLWMRTRPRDPIRDHRADRAQDRGPCLAPPRLTGETIILTATTIILTMTLSLVGRGILTLVITLVARGLGV